VIVRAIGAGHEAFCNGVSVYRGANVVNGVYYDFGAVMAGNVAFGIQTKGGTISNAVTFYGLPSAISQPLANELSMLGAYTAASGDGASTGPFPYPHIGDGDGIHHPTRIGYDAVYLAAFAPVLQLVERELRTGILTSTQFVVSGIGAGLRNSGANHLDVLGGTAGSRVLNNAGNAVLGDWDDAGNFTWKGPSFTYVGAPIIHHVRFTSCQTGNTIGDYCDNSAQSWSNGGFADTSYTVTCTGTGGGGIPGISVLSKTSTTVTTRTVTNFSGGSSGEVSCIAVHD
jgi:hypothetical protein